jgi:hypothetical protein
MPAKHCRLAPGAVRGNGGQRDCSCTGFSLPYFVKRGRAGVPRIYQHSTSRFSEIKRFDIHGPAQDNWIGPTLGLRIFSASSNEPVLTVNIKPFASRDIKRLTDRLTQAIGGA